MPIMARVLGKARRGKVQPTKVGHQTNSHYEKSCPWISQYLATKVQKPLKYKFFATTFS
jgi:hypothetical protein